MIASLLRFASLSERLARTVAFAALGSSVAVTVILDVVKRIKSYPFARACPLDMERNLCHNLCMGKKRRSQPRQLTFEDQIGAKSRGGRPKSKDSGVSHLKREEVSANVPLHVTSKVISGLPDMRSGAAYR